MERLINWCQWHNSPSSWERPVVPNKLGVVNSDPLHAQFKDLAEQWKRETGHISVTRTMATHSAYQSIIGMGDRALSFIFKDMTQEPDRWFWALEHITRVDPVPRQLKGDIDAETTLWLSWARMNGYALKTRG